MKIFISWSGERSKQLAQALRDWLPLVLHYVEPWLSEADISAGERWAEAVAKELEASNFGIISVTRENAASPWVLFEAGALAKSMQDSRVIPLLLDLDFRDITGPLAQFQAKKVEKQGLHEVVTSVNRATGETVPESRANQLFEALWPEFESEIESIPEQPKASKHTRSQHEVLEELVASVRNLDSRLRDQADEGPRRSKYRRMRFHPFLARELSEMIGDRPGDPVILLILGSAFREEAPWLYEIANEAYRAIRSGSREEARRALKRFWRAVEMMERGRFGLEELGIHSKEWHMLFRELRHFPLAELAENPTSDADPSPRATEREPSEDRENDD